MSTNFYLVNKNEKIHIGKRNMAGLWCYDCDQSLYTGPTSEIHSGKYDFHNKCPGCGKTVETITCSFTWALKWEDELWFRSFLHSKNKNFKIVDEYGREFKKKKFMEEIGECKIKFNHNRGREFS